MHKLGSVSRELRRRRTPLATIEPAAIRYGLPVDLPYGYIDIADMETRLMAADLDKSTVFVAWEHKELEKLVKDILSAAGADSSVVPKWKDSDGDYDRLNGRPPTSCAVPAPLDAPGRTSCTPARSFASSPGAALTASIPSTDLDQPNLVYLPAPPPVRLRPPPPWGGTDRLHGCPAIRSRGSANGYTWSAPGPD